MAVKKTLAKHRSLYNADLGKLNDFKNFLFLVWEFLGLPPPTDLQYDMADYLQHAEQPWTIIMAYRGTGKSYITCAFVVWLFMVNPQFKILVISAGEDKAQDFAKLVKQIIDGMEICEHLRPGKNQLNSTLKFDVGPASPSKDPSLNVYGITGQITGGRADFIVPDDIEVPDNSATVTQREKLAQKLNDIIAIIKPASEGHQPQIKMLGTPQTEQSIYFALESKGYQIRIWPARYPTDSGPYKGRLAPTLADAMKADPTLRGKPTNPLMHNEADLKQRSQAGKAWFLLQYMLDPSLSDEERYPLKLKDFMVMHVDPDQGPIHMAWAGDARVMVTDVTVPVVGLNGDRYYRPFKVSDTWRPYQKKIMAIDPAGGNDETAYVVLYYLMGYVFIAEWGGLLGYGPETLTTLAKIAAKHKINDCIVEKNFGAGMFTELFKPYLARHHKCGVEEITVTQQKEKRICDTLEPVLGHHRLIISEAVIKKDFETKKQELQGLWQISHLTRDRGALRKDDRADVLAIGVAHFLDMISQDVEDNEGKLTDELKEKLFEQFMRSATRGNSQSKDEAPGWMNLDGDSEGYDPEAFAEDQPWWEMVED